MQADTGSAGKNRFRIADLSVGQKTLLACNGPTASTNAQPPQLVVPLSSIAPQQQPRPNIERTLRNSMQADTGGAGKNRFGIANLRVGQKTLLACKWPNPPK